MKTQALSFFNGGLVFRPFLVKITRPMQLVSFCLALLMWSCDINPSLQEVSQPKGNLAPVDSKVLSSTSLLPSTVSLDKVDLYLDMGSSTTGNVLVKILDSQTSAIVGTAKVPASSFAIGGSWKTFTFTPALSLIGGNKYKIHIIRSDAHNYRAGNYIFWRTSSSGVDAYPDGINNVYPSWILDYAFKTYTQGTIDQQQTLTNYGFAIGNTATSWQEFKADYPKVSLGFITLNLTVGSAPTGTVTAEIRSADGSTVLAQSVAPTSQIGPGLTQWIIFKFNTILLNRDQPYRIYVTRSDLHDYPANNYIFWRTSSGGVDAYPDGVNDVYPSWTLDYAFRTYSPALILDQHQDLTNYAFFVSNNLYRWQEFVPRN
jgi:hypothetical protein